MRLVLFALCLRILRIPCIFECRAITHAKRPGPGTLLWRELSVRKAQRRFAATKRARQDQRLLMVAILDERHADAPRVRSGALPGSMGPLSRERFDTPSASQALSAPSVAPFKIKRDLVDAVGAGGYAASAHPSHRGTHHDRPQDAQGKLSEGSTGTPGAREA